MPPLYFCSALPASGADPRVVQPAKTRTPTSLPTKEGFTRGRLPEWMPPPSLCPALIWYRAVGSICFACVPAACRPMPARQEHAEAAPPDPHWIFSIRCTFSSVGSAGFGLTSLRAERIRLRHLLVITRFGQCKSCSMRPLCLLRFNARTRVRESLPVELFLVSARPRGMRSMVLNVGARGMRLEQKNAGHQI